MGERTGILCASRHAIEQQPIGVKHIGKRRVDLP